MTTPDPAPPARVRPTLVVLLGVLTAFAPLAIDMYLPSLPTIARDFHAPMERAQITVAAFLAGLAAGQLLYGWASDRFGRRPPLLVGCAVFIAGSLACAAAPTLGLLAAARFLQALGGCAGTVIARAVVRDRFDHRESARVLSLLMLVMGVAPILAPLAGGALLLVAGWRAIFWLLTGLGAAITAVAAFGLRETRSEETAEAARNAHPVRVYLTLARNRKLVGYVLASAFNSAALFTYISAAPGLIIGVYGVPAQAFGWIFGANAVGMIAMSQINAVWLRRATPEQIVAAVRPVSLGVALWMAIDAATGFGGMIGVLAPLFFLMGTFGFIGSNTIAGALSIDPVRAGSASALMGAAQFAVGAGASALMGALGAGAAPMAFVILGAIAVSTAALYGLALPAPASGRRFAEG